MKHSVIIATSVLLATLATTYSQTPQEPVGVRPKEGFVPNIETAVKKHRIRQHRESACAMLLIGAGDGERIKVLAKHSFAW